MPKQTKIKRYHRMYRRHRPVSALFLRALVLVVAVGVLGFIGWSAYGPIMEFLSDAQRPAPASASAAKPQADTPSAPDATPAKPESVMPARIGAVYAPVSAFASADALDKFLDGLSFTDINAVMFDLKDVNGNVLYRSKSETVSKLGTQVAGAYDLKALCEHLAARGLTPIGRMQTFRDPLAGSKLTGAGVTYMNSEMLWLDNARESGGKPWLNPYSDKARGYLNELALEASAMGVKQILLDNVNFPIAFGGLEFATYGGNSATVSRSEALAEFVEELSAALAAQGCSLSVYTGGVSALGLNDMYYGGSVFDVTGQQITLGVMPAQFGDRFTLDDLSLDAPLLDPAGTVTALLGALESDLAGKQVCGLVQGYSDTRTTLPNNRPYTAEDITAQLDALAAGGVESYIIYSPDGTYPS